MRCARGADPGVVRRARWRRSSQGSRPMTNLTDEFPEWVPNFRDAELGEPAADTDLGSWRTNVEVETGKAVDALEWETPEGIAVQPLYTAADVADLDFLDTYPGIKPFLRGPYPTMYVNQPWT